MFLKLCVQLVHFILWRFYFSFESFGWKKSDCWVVSAIFSWSTGPFCPWMISIQLVERTGALQCVLNVVESERRYLYISDSLGSRRPHSNRVSTSACDTRLNCIVPSLHIVVWHYPPWLGKEHSNRVRHSNHSQARRALGSRRPRSNRVSTSACDTRLNCIVPSLHIVVWHYPPLVR